MTAQLIIFNIICVSFFLLALVSFANPVKVNIIANRWFGVFLFSVGCMVLNAIINQTKSISIYSHLFAFNEISRFAMAPSLYLSVLQYTSPNKKFKPREYLHFVPFTLFFLYVVPMLLFPGFRSFSDIHLPAVIASILTIIIFLSVKIQLLVYWILAYYRLNKHQKNIQQITSDTAPITLNWLRFLLFGVVFMLLLWFNYLFFKIEFLSTYTPWGYLVGSLFIGYYLLAQKEIYPYDAPELDAIDTLINLKTKSIANKQRLSEDTLTNLKIKLITLMEHEKLFLDNELNLPQLAAAMAVSIHDVSYVLNEGLNMNFFKFINIYRIEEAKQLMASEKYRHLNILGIAYSAGFNSKTTFNTAFKKETGVSPSQFMQQVKMDAQTVIPTI